MSENKRTITKEEYIAITDRTLAMDTQEIDATLDNVPDSNLINQLIRRYSYLLDYKASIEKAIENVDKHHGKILDDVEWFWV